MKPDICSICRGKLEEGITEFVAHVKDQIVIIEDIPAWICENCGEAYYSEAVSIRIDKVMKKVHAGEFTAKPVAAGKVSLSNY